MATQEQKDAYGENFSQIDVTETNPTSDQLKTETSEEKTLEEIQPALPRKQKKIKFSK